jgi:phosphoglycolate phosphatase
VQPQLLIFDLDGTLVDSRADLAASINHMRHGYGLKALSLDIISGYVGSGAQDLVKRSLQGADISVDDALHVYKTHYNSNLAVHTTTYPGVREGIPELAHAGHKLAVLSNKPGGACRSIMRHFQLDRYFANIVGGGDLERLKPEPDGIFKIMGDSGMDVAHAWMIGDHHTDLAVAQNAGVKSAYVEYGFGDKLDREAVLSFSSFSNLVRYFV